MRLITGEAYERWAVAGAFLVAGLLVAPPAYAGKGDKNAKKVARTMGDIDPTNTPILDDDFSMAMTTTDTSGGAYTIADATTVESEPHLEGSDQIRALEAHASATGDGVVVAVIDGGFNLGHPELAGRLSPFMWDAVDGDGDPEDLGNGIDDDDNGSVDSAVGHGTFIAGMVLMAAPNATIMPVRVRDDEGFAGNAILVEGIEFAVAHGADVINLSLAGSKNKRSGLCEVMEAASNSGVVFVCATGNDGADRINTPAVWDFTIAVSSVDADDVMADFANFDPNQAEHTVFAPGVDLHGPIGALHDASSGTWSGTSFSTGIVSGAAALYIERNPNDNAGNVRQGVLEAVVPAFDANGNEIDKAGRIDLVRVVE